MSALDHKRLLHQPPCTACAQAPFHCAMPDVPHCMLPVEGCNRLGFSRHHRHPAPRSRGCTQCAPNIHTHTHIPFTSVAIIAARGSAYPVSLCACHTLHLLRRRQHRRNVARRHARAACQGPPAVCLSPIHALSVSQNPNSTLKLDGACNLLHLMEAWDEWSWPDVTSLHIGYMYVVHPLLLFSPTAQHQLVYHAVYFCHPIC